MKQTMRMTLTLVETLLVVALLWGASLFFTQVAHAQTGIPVAGVELTGYAWSSNIGWISMNCRTGGTTGNDICATSPYRVTLETDGDLTGYAWSSNIGWIRFGGLSAWPTGGGTAGVDAQVTGNYNSTLNFEGWARACAGTVSAPGFCNDMTSRTDGWDGWISLKGIASDAALSPYGVQMTTTGGLPNTFAWGSSVVGWIDFDQIGLRIPSATITGTGCGNIPIGGSTCTGTVTWNITNATSPNVLNTTIGGTPPYTVASGNSQNITLRADAGGNLIAARDNTTQLQTTRLYASCVAGADFNNGSTCQPTVLPAPAISISTSRAIVRSGETVRVDWAMTPSPVASGSCAITGPGMPSSVTTTGNQTSSALRSKTRFTITCTGPFGSVSSSTQVELIPVAKEV